MQNESSSMLPTRERTRLVTKIVRGNPQLYITEKADLEAWNNSALAEKVTRNGAFASVLFSFFMTKQMASKPIQAAKLTYTSGMVSTLSLLGFIAGTVWHVRTQAHIAGNYLTYCSID